MKNEPKMHWIEGGNHAQRVKGRSDSQIFMEISSAITQWCYRVLGKWSCDGNLADKVCLEDKSEKALHEKKPVRKSKRKACVQDVQIAKQTGICKKRK